MPQQKYANSDMLASAKRIRRKLNLLIGLAMLNVALFTYIALKTA